jgi:hypothetical protein
MDSNDIDESVESCIGSTLPHDTKRALVQLLQGPLIDRERHGIIWGVLIRDEALIRSRMADLFLEVVIDKDVGVAFTRQAGVEGEDAPRILRRMSLTYIDSVLLIQLRRRLLEASERGDRAAVDSTELCEALIDYKAGKSTDHAGFNKKVKASIDKMKKYGILSILAAGEERYEISPALAILFPPEEIKALSLRYEEIASGAALTGEEEGEEAGEEE